MEYKTIKQLEDVADVRVEGRTMSRSERLERWAELLERQANRGLNTFFETEFESETKRDALRCDNSPISVAFADPVLRAAGLRDDTYGQAKKFFELSDRELHRVVCYCHFGATMSAAAAARVIRMTAAHTTLPGVAGWARRYLAHLVF
jgi:hypothetical protein